MLPIGDDNTGRVRTPVVTYALILINVLVFVVLQRLGTNERFTYAFSTVPQEIRTGEDVARPVRVEVGDEAATINLQPTPGSVYLTLLVSMFMHGSLMHLLGNMLFLWIFGDNVEDDLGRLRYGGFYLVTGLAASLAHPRRRVRVLMMRTVTEVPAFVAVGLWFLFQLISAFGVISQGPQAGGGVAFMAHIGGFVAGLVLVKFFAVGARRPAAV